MARSIRRLHSAKAFRPNWRRRLWAAQIVGSSIVNIGLFLVIPADAN
jgi:hypothetical protein